MSMLSAAAAVVVLIAFNLPILVLLISLPLLANLKQALMEKSPIGGAGDTTSYSRIAGLVGAAVMTCFFWAIGNVVLLKAFTAVGEIKPVVDGSGRLFMVGAALFLPYAFNQIKSAFGAAGVAAAAAPVAPAPVAAPGAPTLTLAIANLSSAIDDTAFAAAVAAIAVQVGRDFQPEWGMGAALNPTRLSLSGGKANVDAAADAVIYVGDSASDPTTGASGAYGYHSENYGQTPYAFVYLDVCRQYGEAWSATLSHEVLELLADPTTVLTASGPVPGGAAPAAGSPAQTVAYDLEVCDPTQGDTYAINGVQVSNFVTKAFFAMVGGPSTATNHLGLALDPFGVRPGGYLQYEDSGGSHQLDGPRVDAKRLAARAVLAGYRRNARRADLCSRRG